MALRLALIALQKYGVSVSQLMSGGYTAGEMRTIGYSAEALLAAALGNSTILPSCWFVMSRCT